MIFWSFDEEVFSDSLWTIVPLNPDILSVWQDSECFLSKLGSVSYSRSIFVVFVQNLSTSQQQTINQTLWQITENKSSICGCCRPLISRPMVLFDPYEMIGQAACLSTYVPVCLLTLWPLHSASLCMTGAFHRAGDVLLQLLVSL